MEAGIWSIFVVLLVGLSAIWYRLGKVEGSVTEGFKRLDGVERRLDRLEGGLDGMEERLDRVEGRLGKLEMSIEEGFKRLNEGLREMREELKRKG